MEGVPAPDLQDVIDGTNIWKALLQTPLCPKINANGSFLKGSRKRGTLPGGDDNPSQDPVKGDLAKQPPAKQVRKSNLTEVPEGYYGGICPKCTVVVPNHTAKGCKAKAVAQNRGLLLLQTYTPECFREVQDAICEFLNALTSTTVCTVCDKPCSLSHNPLKCVRELEVYVQDGTLNWRIGRHRRKVNTCVHTDDRHQHNDYEEARQCYLKCKGAQAARKKEIQNLLNAGGNPCPRCGGVFADHTVARCVKYSYLMAGDDGFQDTLTDGAYIALERLEGLHDRLTVGVPEGMPCVSCAGNEIPHDYRGCLKRLKCKKGENGEWVSEPLGDPAQLPSGRFLTACTGCGSLVPDHQVGNCKEKRTMNYGLFYMLEKERPAIIVEARRQKWKYMNGALDLNEPCASCEGSLVREVGELLAFHDPELCLNRWVVYRTKEGELKFKLRTEEPVNHCISSQHTHTTWEAFLQCQEDWGEWQEAMGEIQQFRGNERRWCQRCTDYFVTHKVEECPREGRGNATLAKFLEAKDMGLFRLLRIVVRRLSKR